MDPKGRVSAVFTLPSTIERGDGSLAFVIDDGSGIETAAKTLPIILNKLDIGLFPEGGDLIAGVENRIYIQARRLDGKPADLKGRFVDAHGRVYGTIVTDHEGRGRGTLIPAQSEPLFLQVDSPEGIEPLSLPPARTNGVALQALDQVTDSEAPVRLRLTSPHATTVRCVLSRIEQEIATLKIDLQAGIPSEVTLTPPGSVSGVLIATITDLDGRPLAERLVLRKPRSDVRVRLEAPKNAIPGQQVSLNVITTDAKGRPIPATVGVTVSDDAVRELLETRDHAPRLPAMVLLEHDVDELADAQVYVGDHGSEADQACDPALGYPGLAPFPAL